VSFGSIAFALLVRPEDAPTLPDSEDGALQDAHLAHLASLAEEGVLSSAGPLVEQDDPSVRGIVLLSTPIDDARALLEEDPRVRAGLLEVRLARWVFPVGSIRFGAGEFPRSVAEAAEREQL
jgi:uncharacterized protein